MSRRLKLVQLPEETQPRIRALMEQSAPDPDRPQLDPEREKRLEAVERKSAACYADMENHSVNLRKLAREISSKTKHRK